MRLPLGQQAQIVARSLERERPLARVIARELIEHAGDVSQVMWLWAEHADERDYAACPDVHLLNWHELSRKALRGSHEDAKLLADINAHYPQPRVVQLVDEAGQPLVPGDLVEHTLKPGTQGTFGARVPGQPRIARVIWSRLEGHETSVEQLMWDFQTRDLLRLHTPLASAPTR